MGEHMPMNVVILGAGFAGLELATRLSEDVPGDVAVTLIDEGDAFFFGYSKLDVMFGHEPADAVRIPYREIAKPGVEFRQERVTSIDPHRRRVVTDRGSYEADVLVVALGADLDPAATPGLDEGGYEFYSFAGAERVRDMLPSFDGGEVVISILGPFFKCPAAPYEAALMLHDFMKQRPTAKPVSIKVMTPMGMPIPISPVASERILDELEAREIEFFPETVVTSLDPAQRTASLRGGGTVSYDLFFGIPVHVAPPVVVEGGLTEEDGWIAVDPKTFATRFPDVYAAGDITSAPVPRVGVIAESEAGTVADVLVHRIRGGAEPPPYPGIVSCYIEFGDGRVARFSADFMTGPAPTSEFLDASLELAASKREFGTSRRARWFG
jgi:sulfide:quinone oxidoreductase